MTEETQDVYFNLFKYCYDIIKTPIDIWRIGKINT